MSEQAADMSGQGGARADDTAAEAERLMKARRWRDAAELLDRIESPDIQTQLKRNLARNFDALRTHRPRLYIRMCDAAPAQRYRFAPAPGNRLTIADLRDPQRPVVLTPGGDPAAFAHDAIQQLNDAMKTGGGIGLIGIGDGFLAGVLARLSPKLFMDQQQPVFIVEPDESLLLTCLMLHDYTGAQGPIEQRRFQWFIGPDWSRDLRTALFGDLMLPPPPTLVQQSVDRETIAPEYGRVINDLELHGASLRRRVDAHYARLTGEDFLSAAAARPDTGGRRPRVLLLTTRFSTVLQYATRDAADGFRRLGWEARIAIEPSPHHRWPHIAVRQALAAFKPDVIFQIDHLRHEHEGLIPENVPFVCWIQDHMPHLTTRAAGQRIGQRDFVLTFASPLFIETCGYPERQCIDMPMMLTAPRDASPPRPAGDVPDVAYVSNVSQPPATLIGGLAQRVPTEHRKLADVCGRHLLDLYDRGESIPTQQGLAALIERTARQFDAPPPDEQGMTHLIGALWNPLNSALYRQQALGWAADAADAMGLTLGVYGRGWESHPRFAQYGRGVIQHGDALAALTHHTPINLNLEPYECFTHQRLLDGLMAGGFFLVREHPGNTILQQLLNLLEDEFDAGVATLAHARSAAKGELRRRLDAIVARAAPLNFGAMRDPVQRVRCMQRAGVLVRAEASVPHIDEVSFRTAASCRALIERFIHDAGTRRDIAAAQRRSVAERLTFEAGMRLVVDRVASLLAEETADTAATAECAA